MQAAEERFFQANGSELIKTESMGIESGINYAKVPPGEIYKLCRENWAEEAEGMFVSCMNFNAMPCIGPLERDLGKPVVSSHSAPCGRF